MSFTFGMSTPLSRSSLTTASYPFCAAYDSGVWPLSSLGSSSTLSSSSSFTTALCPYYAAHDSGVRSNLSFDSTSNLPEARGKVRSTSSPCSAIATGENTSVPRESEVAAKVRGKCVFWSTVEEGELAELTTRYSRPSRTLAKEAVPNNVGSAWA
jgi:hypothetical protein